MKHTCFGICVVVAISAHTHVFAAEPGGVDARAPVPGRHDQSRALLELKKEFRLEFAQRSVEKVLAFAAKLLEYGESTEEADAARFVMLSHARDLAMRAGAIETALRAVDALGRSHRIDPWAEKARILAKLRPFASIGWRDLTLKAMSLADRAIAADRYDTALKIAMTAATAARRTRDPALAKRSASAEGLASRLATEWPEVQSAAAMLETDDENAEANQRVGAFYCLLKGEWDRGVRQLARGTDPLTKRAAQTELAMPLVPLDAGEHWLAVAEAETGIAASHAEKRALTWLRRAAQELGGLERARAQKKAREVATRVAERHLGYTLGRHPPDAVELNGHYYKLVKAKLPFAKAQERCRAIGGYLVCVESEEEQLLLNKMVLDTRTHNVVVGAYREGGEWYWVNGSPFEYTRWSVWALNHMALCKEGDVVFIIGHLTGEPGMWNKSPGRSPRAYICEWER